MVKAFSYYDVMSFLFNAAPADPTKPENLFKTYEEQIQALYSMYLATSDFGQTTARTIIDFLVQWIFGNGIRYSVKGDMDGVSNEYTALKELFGPLSPLSAAKLNFYGPAMLIEGKALFALRKSEGNKPVITHYPYLNLQKQKYMIYVNPDDYTQIDRIELGTGGDLAAPYTFVTLGGIGNPNDTPSKLANFADVMYRLDKARAALSMLNRKFELSPLHFEGTGTAEGLDAARDFMVANSRVETRDGKPVRVLDLKVGDTTAGAVKGYFIQPTDAGASSIKTEIELQVQALAGCGVPPHFLGYVAMFSNRATAEELHEVIVSATSKERGQFEEGMYSLAKQWFTLRGGNLNFDKVEISIPATSLQQIQLLVDAYLPLVNSKVISRQTLREKVGDVDQETENKRLQDERSESIKDLSDFLPYTTQPVKDGNTQQSVQQGTQPAPGGTPGA